MNNIEKKVDSTLKNHGVSYVSRRKIRKTASNFVYDTSVIAASTVVSTIILDVVEGTASIAAQTIVHTGHLMARGVNKAGAALKNAKAKKAESKSARDNSDACEDPSELSDDLDLPEDEENERGED